VHAQAQFYHALAQLQVLEARMAGPNPFDRVLGPGQRAELLEELRRGLRAMEAGFGHEHMLVAKARELQRAADA
jgi:hypothetical protein